MATKLKYNRVRNAEEKEDKPQTQIIMRTSSSYGRYVSRALKLFFGEGKSFVTIKAADRLIDRALWVAEIVKRKVEGLHQIIEISEKEIIDIYQPKQQGLSRVEQKRYLTVVEVTLTKQASNDQKQSIGYQAPLELKNNQFLDKQKWQKQQAQRDQKIQERKQRRQKRQDRKNQRGERRTRGSGNNRR